MFFHGEGFTGVQLWLSKVDLMANLAMMIIRVFLWHPLVILASYLCDILCYADPSYHLWLYFDRLLVCIFSSVNYVIVLRPWLLVS